MHLGPYNLTGLSVLLFWLTHMAEVSGGLGFGLACVPVHGLPA